MSTTSRPLFAAWLAATYLPGRRSLPRRLLALPAGLAHLAGRLAERRHPGVSLPARIAECRSGPWANAITHLDAWLIGDEDGHPYLEEQLDSTSHQWTYPIFLTGDPEWSDYTVEVKVKPLNRVDAGGRGVSATTPTGTTTSSALSGGNKATLALHLPLEPALARHAWKNLGSAADFPYDTTRYYTLKVETDGPRIRAFIDGKLVIEANDSEMLKGKARASPTALRASRISTSGLATPRPKRSRSASPNAKPSSPGCATPIPSPSSGRNSTRRHSARDATCASATWMATASPTC